MRTMNSNPIKPKIIFNQSSKDFMGIKIKDGDIKIYVPDSFRIEDEEIINNRNLLLFLDSLKLTNKNEKENIESNDTDKFGDLWPIESYMWIIKDFIENGFFYNREKKYSHDSKGKIDWKRTLKTTPIYSNGNIIYDKIVSSRMTASNDVVAQIYKLCLKHSIQKIGWAFNFNPYIDVVQIKSCKEMTWIIKNELSNTFDDIKRLRFRHMLKVINGVEDAKAFSNNYVYGIKNYHYVYEKMIDQFFFGITGKEKDKYNPSGNWIMINEDKPRLTSKLRPDTIYKTNFNSTDYTFIIDAKMYHYGYYSTNDNYGIKEIKKLPQSDSLQKQITYGDFVKHNLEQEEVRIRNVFIIPYNKLLNQFNENCQCINNDLVYIGKGTVDWRKEHKEEYDYIYAYLIDFNFLLQNFMDPNENYVLSLCKSINNLIKK